MTIISVGYAGTITDDNWRRMATATVGALYGVDDFASWKVTAGVGDRALQVATGGAFGIGVRDVSDDPVTVTSGTVSSGSRWDLVVARRNWGTKVTTIVVIPGSATKALPARNTGFGAVNDQPLALARFAAGQTAVQEIIDLRCIPGDGGMVAFDDLALQYLDRVGTSVWINGTLWQRALSSIGSPVWTPTVMSDTGWTDVTYGPGWGLHTTDLKLRVRAVGAHVELRGAAKRTGNDASVSLIGTIPPAFFPTSMTPLGATYGSAGMIAEKFVSSTGVIAVGLGHITGSAPLNSIVMLQGIWTRG